MYWLTEEHIESLMENYKQTLPSSAVPALLDEISKLENAIYIRIFTGLNGLGQAACNGTQVGDLVISFINMTDLTDGSGIFSVTVTEDNKIEQINVGDYSTKKFLAFILRK
jgi:hypothetical protein